MNWTIKSRLYALIGVSVAVAIGLNGLLYWSVEKGTQGLDDMRNSNDIQSAAGSLDMFHDATRGAVIEYLYSSGEKQATAAKDVTEDVKQLQFYYSEIAKADLPPAVKALHAEVKEAVNGYTNTALEIIKDNDPQANAQKEALFYKNFKFLEEHLDALSKSIDEYVESTAKVDMGTLDTIHHLGMIFGILSFSILVGAGYMIARSVNNQIDKLIKELSYASQEVQQEASQINDASRSLAEASSRQAASLEETAASIEEVSSMVRQTADNSVQAKGLSQEVETASLEGVNTMQQMASAIDSIKVAAEETATIIKTIDEIAFQTNLLALNAAVEAARAGDAGKGFAVVAEEVRSLAQRSSVAAKDTSEKIRRSRDLANNGVKATSEMRRSLELMRDKVTKTTCLINEIAAANQEQSVGLREVNKAASHLDQSTQQNAAQSEELSAASDQLLNQSKALQGVVTNLSALVYGGAQQEMKKVVKEKAVKAAPVTPPPAQEKAEEKSVKPKKEETQIITIEEPVTPQHKAKKPARANNAIELKPEQIIPLDDGDFQGF